jgi:hypothetical protein
VRRPALDSAAFLLVAIFAYTAGVHAPRSTPAAAAAPGPDIVACKKLADEAGVSIYGGMTEQGAQLLMLTSLADHGLRPPRLSATGNQIAIIGGTYRRVEVSRMTQRDIQAAADELKTCFPAK